MKSGIQPSQIVSCEAPAPYARHMVLTLKLATLALVMAAQSLVADIIRDFAQPPPKYRPTSLYWLNNNIENPVIDLQLPRFREKDGYGSVAILPVAEWSGTEFIGKYGHLLDKLDELGMWAIFCNDKSFHSGTIDGGSALSIQSLVPARSTRPNRM